MWSRYIAPYTCYSFAHMAKILITDNIQLGDYDFPDMEIDNQAGIEREALLKIAADYDAIITRSRTTVDAELIAAAKNMRILGRAGVGVDNIDIDAASRRGVVILNAPEANNISAAELAIGLMLNAARGISRSDQQIRSGVWDRKYLGQELNGASLGIIGLGRIGSLVAKRANGLGMKVMAYDPYISRHRAESLKVALFDDLNKMLKVSEFLTIHTPLTDETKGMLALSELEQLPLNAIVVNAARGGIIVEDALLEMLKSKKIFAAGLDVFVLEPPNIEHPLLQLDNIVFTAHLGANTAQAQARVGSEILERTVMALRGDFSRGAVNAPALDPAVVELLGEYLNLAELLGKIVAQLASGRVRELEIEFAGDFGADPEPIVSAVAKGYLEPILDEKANYINALAILKDRDIRVSKVIASRSKDYTSQILVKAKGQDFCSEVAGTVMANKPRVVSINATPIEIMPEGTMLVCSNYDRPGAIGKIGSFLGRADINISSMQLARVGKDDLAMFVLTLNKVPSEATIKGLRALTDVLHSLKVVKL